jgi:hypothetical protein
MYICLLKWMNKQGVVYIKKTIIIQSARYHLLKPILNPFKLIKMQKIFSIISCITLVFALILFSGCGQGAQREAETPQRNVLSEAEIADGWELLFDGKTTSGWRGFQKEDLTIDEGWYVHNGELAAAGTGGDIGGDIVTNRKFRNFIFETEWRIDNGGNSGIFYLVGENGYKAVYETGPEYQLLDDLGFMNTSSEPEPWHMTGANYGMHAPSDPEAFKPATNPNTTRIVVNNGHVEHWLNGVKVVEYELWSDEWKELVASGKWADFPDYGRYREGHIALQDHGSRVWFWNMKIKELD